MKSAFLIILNFIFLCLDLKPNYNFRDDISAYFIIRLQETKPKSQIFNLKTATFNILSIEL
jgi:hypothetical protein